MTGRPRTSNAEALASLIETESIISRQIDRERSISRKIFLLERHIQMLQEITELIRAVGDDPEDSEKFDKILCDRSHKLIQLSA